MSSSGPCWGREGCMAYREVTMLEVKEVLRLWLGGAAHKRIAAQLGLNVKTVRRYVVAAQASGVGRESGPEGLDDAPGPGRARPAPALPGVDLYRRPLPLSLRLPGLSGDDRDGHRGV